MATKDSSGALAQEPKLCANGCGFFGQGELNLCSKCHAEHMRKNNLEVAPPSTPPAAPAEASAESSEGPKPKPTQANKSRCWKCDKKCGLLGIECNCGYTFCAKHRQGEDHDCEFDYKTVQRAQLAAANQKCEAEKFERI